MKNNKRLFSELVATGLYSSVSAVELVWVGDEKVDAKAKAQDLMEDKRVIKLIARIKEDIKLLASPTKEWVKFKLMRTIEDASKLNDFSTIRYCLDQLNKIDGNYDLTNVGIDGVNLNMSF